MISRQITRNSSRTQQHYKIILEKGASQAQAGFEPKLYTARVMQIVKAAFSKCLSCRD